MASALVYTLVCVVMVGVGATDVFTAYNCQEPEDTKFISHEECHKPMPTTKAKQIKILQKKTVYEIKGYVCEGFKTTEVSFCGAYSHNKQTGESRFNIPISFTQLECLTMISSKKYVTDSMTFPLTMNNMNSFQYYTHGSISYTNTNIHCTGEGLRLQNGEVNANMLRQEHVLIHIGQYQLIADDDTVIDPTSQIKLGQIQKGNARSGTKTYIWNNAKKPCQLMQILDTTMETNNERDWISHLHKIKITALDSFHHAGCNMKLTKTNIKNIYLSDANQQGDIGQVDAKNVDLAAELNTRFGFIYGEMSSQLTKEYMRIDPICHRFQSSGNEAQRIDNNVFVKSLGDTSISFKCRQVQVAPNPSPKCHSMAPVTDINGVRWFLNPNNRMLTSDAVEVPCNIAVLPVYMNQKYQMIMFNPERRLINAEKKVEDTNNSTTGKEGLYSQELIKQWLDNSYIQHWNKLSYSTLVNIFCQDDQCKQGHTNIQSISAYVGGSLAKISMEAAEKFMWGVNIEKIGRICSIAVIILLIIYIAYSIIAWAVRYVLFNHEGLKTGAKICRATFPDFFIYLYSHNNNTQPKNADNV